MSFAGLTCCIVGDSDSYIRYKTLIYSGIVVRAYGDPVFGSNGTPATGGVYFDGEGTPVNDNSFLLIVRDAGAISSESLQLQMNRVVQREINIQYMCFILFNYWLLVLYLFIDE